MSALISRSFFELFFSCVSEHVSVACDLTGKLVLVVDDSLLNLKMVTMLLKRFGAECVQATDGLQAVEIIRSAMFNDKIESNADIDADAKRVVFDVVIMDNLMPVMNGPEAAILLRKMGFKNLIFGLTGDAQQEKIDMYLNAGANFVFNKPIDLPLFKAKVNYFIKLI